MSVYTVARVTSHESGIHIYTKAQSITHQKEIDLFSTENVLVMCSYGILLIKCIHFYKDAILYGMLL